MESKLFYCYSCQMKDFLKSQGLSFIMKASHHKTGRPFFVFEKSEMLDRCIKMWNEIKFKN